MRKACVDCVHYYRSSSNKQKCSHEKTRHFDVVDGFYNIECRLARTLAEECGPFGKLYEER